MLPNLQIYQKGTVNKFGAGLRMNKQMEQKKELRSKSRQPQVDEAQGIKWVKSGLFNKM